MRKSFVFGAAALLVLAMATTDLYARGGGGQGGGGARFRTSASYGVARQGGMTQQQYQQRYQARYRYGQSGYGGGAMQGQGMGGTCPYSLQSRTRASW